MKFLKIFNFLFFSCYSRHVLFPQKPQKLNFGCGNSNKNYGIFINLVKKESIKNQRILGENFVKNNKNRGNIIINNKKKSIISIIPIDT